MVTSLSGLSIMVARKADQTQARVDAPSQIVSPCHPLFRGSAGEQGDGFRALNTGLRPWTPR